MKKLTAILLALFMVLGSVMLVACNKGGNGGDTTGTEASGTQAQNPAESDKSTDAATEAAPTEAEVTEPPAPSFDTTQPYDGINASFGWYLENTTTTYTLKNVYDLVGFTMLVHAAGTKVTIYFDDSYMLLTDTNSDGRVDDESNYNQFNAVKGSQFDGCTINLDADCDLNGHYWTPIGVGTSFKGVFNGNEHTVSNFKIRGEEAKHTSGASLGCYYGFFGCINGATITDLTLNNFETTLGNPESHMSGGAALGGVVANCAGDGTNRITGCNVYNWTIKIENTGKLEQALVSYISGNLHSAQCLVSDCEVYNVKIDADASKYSICENQFVGAVGGGGDFAACVKDCVVLTRDPYAE